MKVMTGLLAAGLAATAALAAEAVIPVVLTPEPRWQPEPGKDVETETVCEAVRRECPQIRNLAEIRVEVGLDEIYNADGRLVGLRLTRSSGCKPIDEAQLISWRRFRLNFHEEGKSDLNDDLQLELSPGVPRDGVRVIKPSDIDVGFGCNPR